MGGVEGSQLTQAPGRTSIGTSFPAPDASRLERYLPYVVGATLLVAVFPIVVVSALGAAGVLHSYVLTGVLAILVSTGASWAGVTWWQKRPESRDVLFCDLMVWGWVRRWRAERRLSDARSLLGLEAGSGRAIDTGHEDRLELFEQLAQSLEARDGYTHGHTRRVTRYSSLIARRLRLPREQVARITAAAAVHDVGKLNVPREVLNKPDRLTDEEFAVIKRHPVDGADMVAPLGDEQITAMVRHHHERLDGTGYPDGLSGEEIPLGARIIAVADTFDAITSSRAYRGAKSHKQAMAILTKEAGTQLDPAAVRAFCDHYSGRRGLAAWIVLAAMAPQRAVAWMGTELNAAGLGAAAPWMSALAVSVPLAGSLAAAPLVHSTHSRHRSASVSAARHAPQAQVANLAAGSPVAARSAHGAATRLTRHATTRGNGAVSAVHRPVASSRTPSHAAAGSGSAAGATSPGTVSRGRANHGKGAAPGAQHGHSGHVEHGGGAPGKAVGKHHGQSTHASHGHGGRAPVKVTPPAAIAPPAPKQHGPPAAKGKK
jgi:HD domain